MRVAVLRLFASARDAAGVERDEVPGATVGAVISTARARYGEGFADLLEIEGDNPFRIRAYRNGARTLRGLGQDVHTLIERGEDITRLSGIGKNLAAKIHEILETARAVARRLLLVSRLARGLLGLRRLQQRCVEGRSDGAHVPDIDGFSGRSEKWERLPIIPGF